MEEKKRIQETVESAEKLTLEESKKSGMVNDLPVLWTIGVNLSKSSECD